MNNLTRRFSEPSLRHSSLLVQTAPSAYVSAMLKTPVPTSNRLDSSISYTRMTRTSFPSRSTCYYQNDPLGPKKRLYPSLLHTTLEEEEICDLEKELQDQHNHVLKHGASGESNAMKKARLEDANLGSINLDSRPRNSLKSLVKRISTTILNPRTFRRSRSDSQLNIPIKNSGYPGPSRNNEDVLVFGDENPDKINQCTTDFYLTYFPYLAVDNTSLIK